VSDARDQVLQRLAGRSGPGDPELARAWQQQPTSQQHRLRRTATDPVAARHLDDDLERELVAALAAERAGRRSLDIAVPVLAALLVFSTVWGFGRATYPQAAHWALLVGVVAALITTVAGWRRRARLRRDARSVCARLRSH
jgi:hypothetical protein